VAYPDGRLSMEAGLAVVREAAASGTLVGSRLPNSPRSTSAVRWMEAVSSKGYAKQL